MVISTYDQTEGLAEKAVNKTWCEEHRKKVNKLYRIQTIKRNKVIDEETRQLMLKVEGEN